MAESPTVPYADMELTVAQAGRRLIIDLLVLEACVAVTDVRVFLHKGRGTYLI